MPFYSPEHTTIVHSACPRCLLPRHPPTPQQPSQTTPFIKFPHSHSHAIDAAQITAAQLFPLPRYQYPHLHHITLSHIIRQISRRGMLTLLPRHPTHNAGLGTIASGRLGNVRCRLARAIPPMPLLPRRVTRLSSEAMCRALVGLAMSVWRCQGLVGSWG